MYPPHTTIKIGFKIPPSDELTRAKVKTMKDAEDILSFWFGEIDGEESFPEEKAKMWFSEDENVDSYIRQQFEDYLKSAQKGELSSWLKTPQGFLAYIILLDQFPRNMYRDKPEAYENDTLSLRASLEAIKLGFDKQLKPIERIFIYMPLMHSESLDMQKKCVRCFEELLQDTPEKIKDYIANSLHYAKRHMKMIERFGRFPYRNTTLGRESTPEEIEYLKQPDSTF